MLIQIRKRGVTTTAETDRFVEEHTHGSLDRFSQQVRSVTVDLHQEPGHRHGDDEECKITVQMNPSGSLRVVESGDSTLACFMDALHKVVRLVQKQVERSDRGRDIRHQNKRMSASNDQLD